MSGANGPTPAMAAPPPRLPQAARLELCSNPNLTGFHLSRRVAACAAIGAAAGIAGGGQPLSPRRERMFDGSHCSMRFVVHRVRRLVFGRAGGHSRSQPSACTMARSSRSPRSSRTSAGVAGLARSAARLAGAQPRAAMARARATMRGPDAPPRANPVSDASIAAVSAPTACRGICGNRGAAAARMLGTVSSRRPTAHHRRMRFCARGREQIALPARLAGGNSVQMHRVRSDDRRRGDGVAASIE